MLAECRALMRSWIREKNFPSSGFHRTRLKERRLPSDQRAAPLGNQEPQRVGGGDSKFDYGYDAQGQITSETQQTDTNDPQKWAMLYDNEGKLQNVNVTDTVTSAVLHQYAYTYDPAGTAGSEQIDGDIVSASYNNLNQLTGQSAGGKMVFSGSLNKAGTVSIGGSPAVITDSDTEFRGTASVAGTNTEPTTNNVPIVATNVNGYAVTNSIQVVVPPTSGSYTYDANGNLTYDGSSTYSWDAENELVKITYASGAFTGCLPIMAQARG